MADKDLLILVMKPVEQVKFDHVEGGVAGKVFHADLIDEIEEELASGTS